MQKTKILFVLMRGGTSRGPFFKRTDLPENRNDLADVLIKVIGAGHALNIDGIGGGSPVTCKVAILSHSDDPNVDIDYFFAQVSVDEKKVDFSPSCGNMLAGVAPAAIELGLMQTQDDETIIRIRSVNTGTFTKATIQTRQGLPVYDGEARIDGVPGTAAPIILSFSNVAGSKTGAMFPTGSTIDTVLGFRVTLIDVAMPMIMFRAEDLGLRGDESVDELNSRKDLFDTLEPVRIEAGLRMGLAKTAQEVSRSVVPKVGFLSTSQTRGHIVSRYIMPQGDRWDPHHSHAVTGAICVSACALAPGTVADGMLETNGENPTIIGIEHPSGVIDCVAQYSVANDVLDLQSVGILRTARKLIDGHVFLPAGAS